MDPQQELFSALLVKLRKYGKEKGYGVYDGNLPPDGTPYPFIYLAETTQGDIQTKSKLNGMVNQSIDIWSDNPRKRGTVSGILADIKMMCRETESTKHFSWQVRNINQNILPDDTTKQPLLHGKLQIDFYFC